MTGGIELTDPIISDRRWLMKCSIWDAVSSALEGTEHGATPEHMPDSKQLSNSEEV